MAVADEPDGGEGQRQDAGLDPIGHALRQTYHAENHDSLGNDLTGLMLQLARVDDATATPSIAMQGPAELPVAAATPARPTRWWERLFVPVRPR